MKLHPDENLLVLESASTVGGVWAKHRLYPGLRSNNMLGTYEYPDFPMNSATFGVQPGEHIPAAVLHQYLTKYAEHFPVFRRIRFNTTVESAEETADGSWTLTAGEQTADGSWALTASEQPTDDAMPIPSQLQTKKLIVATGLTSEPNMPDIPGSSAFTGLLFHSKDFQHHAASLESARDVAVLGGAKPAWDVAYAYTSTGVRVDDHPALRQGPRVDGAAVRDAAEEVAREARAHQALDLAQPVHLGGRRRVRQDQKLPARHVPGPLLRRPVLEDPVSRRDRSGGF
jgi:cation diffusion facilitator CzcD-associated flavoprotein CzcO